MVDIVEADKTDIYFIQRVFMAKSGCQLLVIQ